MTNYGRVAAEEIFWRTNYEAAQRPKQFLCSTFPTCFHISISRCRRVVVVVLEVTGTLLVGVLLPRGEVLFVGSLDLLAVFLEENEPALLTVTALWRGRGARVGALGLGRVEFATASQSGRRGGA